MTEFTIDSPNYLGSQGLLRNYPRHVSPKLWLNLAGSHPNQKLFSPPWPHCALPPWTYFRRGVPVGRSLKSEGAPVGRSSKSVGAPVGRSSKSVVPSPGGKIPCPCNLVSETNGRFQEFPVPVIKGRTAARAVKKLFFLFSFYFSLFLYCLLPSSTAPSTTPPTGAAPASSKHPPPVSWKTGWSA